MRSSVILERLGVESQLLHIERSQLRSFWHLTSFDVRLWYVPPGMSHWEEAPEQTQDLLEKLYPPAGLGTPRCSPGGARGGGQGERDLGLFALAAAPMT